LSLVVQRAADKPQSHEQRARAASESDSVLLVIYFEAEPVYAVSQIANLVDGRVKNGSLWEAGGAADGDESYSLGKGPLEHRGLLS
jgi:hypothetical protein